MKVYQPGTKGTRTHFVTPGGEFPVAHFLDQDKKPIMFSVKFVEGVAEVMDSLGEYMIDKGIASSSPVIVPSTRIIL